MSKPELGDRHKFHGNEAKCIGVVRYVDRVVYVFEMLFIGGLYEYRSVVAHKEQS